MEESINEQRNPTDTVEPALTVHEPVGSTDVPVTTTTTTTEQAAPISLVQSMLQEQSDETENKKKKKKKKAKSGRLKEIDRLTKATKDVFTTPEKLNAVCERIHSTLSNHKKILLEVCKMVDKNNSGFLSYEDFRLIIKDRLPQLSREDFFVLTKLFEKEGLIDYRTILDVNLGNGVLKHITQYSVPAPKEIILEKKLPKKSKEPIRPSNEPFTLTHPRYVTLHLRFITFENFNAYPGHIHLTVPDHMSVYALSKMVIEQTDLATRNINIYREKVSSRNGRQVRHGQLDPMRSLEECRLIGTYVDGTHKQSFPSYTLYYDYSPMELPIDCPILKCDYFMK